MATAHPDGAEGAAGPAGTRSIVDLEELAEDLRLAVAYASRAGLLQEPAVLQLVQAAEPRVPEGGSAPALDLHALTRALASVSRLILPVTVADLRNGRDPFAPAVLRSARAKQLALTLMAILLLVLIGDYMQALRQEQDALASVQQILLLKPHEKVTALRRLAQQEIPKARSASVSDQYHQRVAELHAMRFQIESAHKLAYEATITPLWPFGATLRDYAFQMQAQEALAQAASSPGPTELPESDPVGDGAEECSRDAHGDVRLPPAAQRLPGWMQGSLLELVGDYCFQVRVLAPGSGADQFQPITPTFTSFAYHFAPSLKAKIGLRAEWFLPFLYGVLGALLFVMRNIANMRTPAMEWFPIVMRIALGGVAGIVVGWFGSPAFGQTPTVSAVSFPFVLAFLTGYGIEALFAVLDRLSSALGQVTTSKA